MQEALPPPAAADASSDELQLDRAEFSGGESGGAPRCAACRQALAGSYYEVDGHTVCAACHLRVVEVLQRRSEPGAFSRAALAGLGAGAVGAALYFAVRSATGYQVGLISILVGFLVGKAVHWGSGGRGGWPYQALAMLLTYLAIVSTYVPLFYQAQMAQAQHLPAGVAAAILNAAVLVLAAAAVPFMGGARILGLIIIGIGLYEAWKLNRRPVLRVSGPHVLGGAFDSLAGARHALDCGPPGLAPAPTALGARPQGSDAAPPPRGLGLPAVDPAAPIRPR